MKTPIIAAALLLGSLAVAQAQEVENNVGTNRFEVYYNRSSGTGGVCTSSINNVYYCITTSVANSAQTLVGDGFGAAYYNSASVWTYDDGTTIYFVAAR